MHHRLAIALLLLLALAAPAWGQRAAIWISTVANLPASCEAGVPFIVTDGASASDCSTGGGSTLVWCGCDAGGSSYSAFGDGGGGSSEWTDSGAAGTLTPNESDDDVQEDATTPTWMLDAAGHIGTDTRVRIGDADADASSACLSVASDAIYHDTDCDGTKDAGEENVGQAGGAASVERLTWGPQAMLALETQGETAGINNNIAPWTTASGTNVAIYVADFDDTTDECRSVRFVVHPDIDTSGSVEFGIGWFSSAASPSGNTRWGLFHDQGRAHNTAFDAAPTTEEQSASDAAGSQEVVQHLTWTETVTNLAWAADDRVLAELCRDTSVASNMTGDARVVYFYIEVPR